MILNILVCSCFVPIAFVHTYYPSALHADASIGQKVGWVGKNHVELEVKLPEQLFAVTMQQCEVSVG